MHGFARPPTNPDEKGRHGHIGRFGYDIGGATPAEIVLPQGSIHCDYHVFPQNGEEPIESQDSPQELSHVDAGTENEHTSPASPHVDEDGDLDDKEKTVMNEGRFYWQCPGTLDDVFRSVSFISNKRRLLSLCHIHDHKVCICNLMLILFRFCGLMFILTSPRSPPIRLIIVRSLRMYHILQMLIFSQTMHLRRK